MKGHINLNETERRKKMEDMIKNIGSAAWGVFDKDDTIDFIRAGGGDATKTFIQPIKLSNEEISKAFAGEVATFDEKSFVGSAEVQERIFNELIIAFMRNVGFIVNNQLIPRMVIHRMILPGFRHKWKAEEILSINDRAKIITELTKVGYEFTPDTVTDEVGIKVEGFGVPIKPVGQMSTIMNDVKSLYKDFI